MAEQPPAPDEARSEEVVAPTAPARRAARPPARRGRLQEIAIILVAVAFTFGVGRVVVVAFNVTQLVLQLIILVIIYVLATAALTQLFDRLSRR